MYACGCCPERHKDGCGLPEPAVGMPWDVVLLFPSETFEQIGEAMRAKGFVPIASRALFGLFRFLLAEARGALGRLL